MVIGDENPLHEPERWRRTVADSLGVPLFTVDADVVVPTSFFNRAEYAARTIRPKIHRVLDRFLEPSNDPIAHRRLEAKRSPWSADMDPATVLRDLPVDDSVGPVDGVGSGPARALKVLSAFIEKGLAGYPERRNHPELKDSTSGLSPYLHFGNIGPRTVANSVIKSNLTDEHKEPFLEQLIVRRELAINFVKHNGTYDRWEGLPQWARKTLEEHAIDPRPWIYDVSDLEARTTIDPLFNAAQYELMTTGWMHNYARMYWAKKILEWSRHPAEALQTAITLNDRYGIDGRDPNGYTRIAWAIGGVHDRPWTPKRPIFGVVRYMSFASTSRKFDYRAYSARVGMKDK